MTCPACDKAQARIVYLEGELHRQTERIRRLLEGAERMRAEVAVTRRRHAELRAAVDVVLATAPVEVEQLRMEVEG